MQMPTKKLGYGGRYGNGAMSMQVKLYPMTLHADIVNVLHAGTMGMLDCENSYGVGAQRGRSTRAQGRATRARRRARKPGRAAGSPAAPHWAPTVRRALYCLLDPIQRKRWAEFWFSMRSA